MPNYKSLQHENCANSRRKGVYMKFKWIKKRFTFMVIPDNDPSSSVVRFRVHSVVLYLISLALFAIMAFSLTLYIIHSKSSGLTTTLQKELSGQEQQYSETVSTKNMTIEQLQNKVIALSQQADEIKVKVGEMQKLDDEVKSLTNPSAAPKKKDNTVIGSDNTGGKGGPFVAVTDGDINTLADTTVDSYKQLSDQMNKLSGSLAETKKKVLDSIHLLQITPTIWPVNTRYISSDFGYRSDPFTYSPTYHSGVDIVGDKGDPVYVTADGVVITAAYDNMHGNNVVVDHSNGIRTWYMHMNKIIVSEGDHVTKGQQIGMLGTTGRSTGPHLHYELKKNGVSVDPKPYLKTSRKGE
jgi:murein DD-endopeptidase MepM/ murein hydrolase activator NlpD